MSEIDERLNKKVIYTHFFPERAQAAIHRQVIVCIPKL